MNDDLNRSFGAVEAKVEAIEGEIEALYAKVDNIDNRFRSLEINIKDLTKIIESQKKTIDEVDTVIKSLALLKRIGYIAIWLGGAFMAWKSSSFQGIIDYFKK